MRTKLLFFALGLVCRVLPAFLVPSYYRDKSLLRSPKNGTSQPRIESIPIESICSSMSSGTQMLGDDHLTIWGD